MYRPRHFDPPERGALLALMRAHPLATLIRSGADGLCADPLPLIFDDLPSLPAVDGGGRPAEGRLRGHVARANPLWREADGADVLVQFNGPQAYVSPSWYPSKREHGKVVPTWNYMIVQARGRLRAIDDGQWTAGLVRELTDLHESGRPVPWGVDDAPEDYLVQMRTMIVGIEIVVFELVGKWKLSQNRLPADRAGVVEGLAQEPGDEAREMSRRVADPAAG